ncbi:diaminopropionate ammonia-lyase [Palleronia sediminis]|uniref:Diaminopropionate ammonia-lyase n=1 Tax=Palleronia sediminis TaxID=2547833 RepID=A0A4R6ADL0_9RHOB|nr:diaminopropionate ammonia-lyase [Palleronia sediminis]TDL81185.1 diaminopropionate ammonia-lyase [Palleronia sediminis]
MTSFETPARHAVNPAASGALRDEAAEAITEDASGAAADEITSWPGYAPTPVIDLSNLARIANVGAVLYKDEAHRFTLGSFKALGGAYAVLRVIQNKLAEQELTASAPELIDGAHANIVSGITVACATDGNHGRSVAWGAQMFGCACRIYIHENVSEDREAGIAAFGATMVRMKGDYDDSVRACARDAEANGWILVADTNAGGGSPLVPTLVTQGYTIIVRELLDQLAEPPTHVFVPAGVGGLAAAISGYWTLRAGKDRPRMIVVEPHVADCVFRALKTGTPKPLGGDVNSFMACLSAGEVSPVAWPVLHQAIDDMLTIGDSAAIDTMRLLAEGRYGDPPLVSGESGCAPIAAILAAAGQPAIRSALGIDTRSRLLAIGSEGATAPDLWAKVVGSRPDAVGAA